MRSTKFSPAQPPASYPTSAFDLAIRSMCSRPQSHSGFRACAERHAELRQRILDAGWDLPEVPADDDPVRLHLPQLLDQHLLADARHQPPQLAESPRPRREMPEDDRLPLAADDGERRLQAAAVGLRFHRRPPGGTYEKVRTCPPESPVYHSPRSDPDHQNGGRFRWREARRQGGGHHRRQQRHRPGHGQAVRRRRGQGRHHRPPAGGARRGGRRGRPRGDRRAGRRLEARRPRPALRHGQGEARAGRRPVRQRRRRRSSPRSARSPRSTSTSEFGINVKGLLFTVQKALPLFTRRRVDHPERLDRLDQGDARLQRLQRDARRRCGRSPAPGRST